MEQDFENGSQNLNKQSSLNKQELVFYQEEIQFEDEELQLYQEFADKLDSPEPDMEAIKNNNFIFIRHAFSYFNLRLQKEWKSHGYYSKQVEEVRKDPILIDPLLHPYGVMQCIRNQEKINKIDFGVVFVSPLRRTIQTTVYLFRNHRNFQNIKFILLPIIKECLNTTNDVPIDFQILKKWLVETKCPIKFDLSYIESFSNPELYYFNVLSNRDVTTQLYNELQQIENQEKLENSQKETEKLFTLDGIELKNHNLAAFKVVLKHDLYNDIEPNIDAINRVNQSINFFKSFQKQNPLKDGQKYAVITHYSYLSVVFSDQQLDENGKLKDKIFFKNCEMKPISFDF